MKIKALFAGCFTLILVTSVYAKKPDNKGKENIQLKTQLMDERVSELMADRVNKNFSLTEHAKLNELGLEELIERENLMFPADELYQSHWDNRFVNPFQGKVITYPDSAKIDCSKYLVPIDGDVKVTSKYGMRRRRMHRGIDLKVQIGDTIRAAFDGKVRIRSFERRGYGNYLVVRHTNGLETVYGHLSKFIVNENDIVRAGDPIGLGGNTGRSTGSHLHFEMRFLGIDLNPAELIDFENGVPHKDLYVFRNLKVNGRKSNIYTSSDTKMAYHRVKSGDNLGAIARRYGTTVSELCRLNGIKSTSTLRIGQSLRVNAGGQTTTTTQPKATPAKPQTATAPGTAKAEVNEGASESIYHKIQSGDNLGKIARKYGTTVKRLCELNNISETTTLRTGKTLRCS